MLSSLSHYDRVADPEKLCSRRVYIRTGEDLTSNVVKIILNNGHTLSRYITESFLNLVECNR